jgi:hypothetical protein
MSRRNRYAGACIDCGQETPAGCGTLSKTGRIWTVICGECHPLPAGDSETTQVDTFTFGHSDGRRQVFYRNRRGRCEDAPSCGCCNI